MGAELLYLGAGVAAVYVGFSERSCALSVLSVGVRCTREPCRGRPFVALLWDDGSVGYACGLRLVGRVFLVRVYSVCVWRLRNRCAVRPCCVHVPVFYRYSK